MPASSSGKETFQRIVGSLVSRPFLPSPLRIFGGLFILTMSDQLARRWCASELEERLVAWPIRGASVLAYVPMGEENWNMVKHASRRRPRNDFMKTLSAGFPLTRGVYGHTEETFHSGWTFAL